jgi:UDP-glucose 4-epimerase
LRVLVTGAAGFIGSHVAGAALAAGHELAVIDDLSLGSRNNVPSAAQFYEVDIRDRGAIFETMRDFRPDVVSHQAAQASVSVSVTRPAFDSEVNVLGTIHLADACVEVGAQRIVFASTGGAIYGEVPERELAPVTAPARPQSPYACAKLSAEHYLRYYEIQHGLSLNILRYANVYGPRQNPHGEAGVVAIFAARLLRDLPLEIFARARIGDAGCVRDYVYIDDVVRANMAAIEGRLDVPVLNVATGCATTTRTVADQLCAALGVEAELEFSARRPGDLERSVLDPGEFVQRLGRPIAFEAGLERTASWFAEQPRE